jgi:hypothetical protein
VEACSLVCRVTVLFLMFLSDVLLSSPLAGGLDTFTAYSVAHLLRDVSHQHNRTIVATIHQPSSEIFHLFDDLCLLDQGKVIYHGPASECMTYFKQHLGFSIPDFTNPADYIFMQILNAKGKAEEIGAGNGVPAVTDAEENGRSPGQGKNLTEEGKSPENGFSGHSNGKRHVLRAAPSSVSSAKLREQRLADTWNLPAPATGELPPARVRLNERVEKASHPTGRQLPTSVDLASQGPTLMTQWKYLADRAAKDVVRNPFKLKARIGQCIFVGIFCGLVYLQVGHAQDSVQNRSGVLFFLVAGGIMNATMGQIGGHEKR